MKKTLAFLHSVKFKEPFGLTLIEAMACGCPVIAFSKGSIPEIIKNGKSGFVTTNTEGMIRALKKISYVSRNITSCPFFKNFATFPSASLNGLRLGNFSSVTGVKTHIQVTSQLLI